MLKSSAVIGIIFSFVSTSAFAMSCAQAEKVYPKQEKLVATLLTKYTQAEQQAESTEAAFQASPTPSNEAIAQAAVQAFEAVTHAYVQASDTDTEIINTMTACEYGAGAGTGGVFEPYYPLCRNGLTWYLCYE